jgi:hypothetical protein
VRGGWIESGGVDSGGQEEGEWVSTVWCVLSVCFAVVIGLRTGTVHGI